MVRSEKLSQNTCKNWDVIVIGAGPAGALAAYLLAKESLKVLLVDKAEFPRSKVCGCCINSAALGVLGRHGLLESVEKCGGVPLTELRLFNGDQKATVNLPGGLSLSRSSFDATLIESAIQRGATFLAAATAKVLDATSAARSVQVQTDSCTEILNAKIVLDADGIGGHSLDAHADFQFITDRNSRFGCGTIVDDAQDYYQPGHIYMACAPGGYVGLVRLEDGRVDVAAAFDRDYSREHAGPAGASVSILQMSNMPVPPSLAAVHWTGTESLTRRRKKIAGERLLVLGDSCGYAEPFTGEGIAWALASASECEDLVLQGVRSWSPMFAQEWQSKHQKLLKSRQDRSILIAQALRKNTVRQISLSLIASFPTMANWLVQKVSAPEPQQAAR